MNLLEKIKFLKEALTVWSEFQQELAALKAAPGFSWKVTAWKGAKSFGATAALVFVFSLWMFFTDPSHLQQAGLSEKLATALAPFLASLLQMAVNKYQERGQQTIHIEEIPVVSHPTEPIKVVVEKETGAIVGKVPSAPSEDSDDAAFDTLVQYFETEKGMRPADAFKAAHRQLLLQARKVS